jgi:hypothetical protein
MRKSSKLILVAGAVAALVVPAAASADVPRFQDTVTTPTVTTVVGKTATFTVLQPKDTTGQFTNVWKHVYIVTVNPESGTFEGSGSVTANGVGDVVWTETITGKFNDDGTVTFNTVPNAGATFAVTNAPMNNTTVIADSTWAQNTVEFRIGAPEFQDETVTTGGDTTTTTYKNHGQYVKTQIDSKQDAAQSYIGMPVQSQKNKK